MRGVMDTVGLDAWNSLSWSSYEARTQAESIEMFRNSLLVVIQTFKEF
jgi:hypothetical protein